MFLNQVDRITVFVLVTTVIVNFFPIQVSVYTLDKQKKNSKNSYLHWGIQLLSQHGDG